MKRIIVSVMTLAAAAACGQVLHDNVAQKSKQNSAGSSDVTHGLETTRWVPIAFGTTAVALAPQQSEPFLVLDGANHRVSGFSGCNRLNGGYASSAKTLSFSQVASTKMMCSQGMDLEQGLFKAMNATAAWRIEGDKLELLDGQGAVVAKLVARNQ